MLPSIRLLFHCILHINLSYKGCAQIDMVYTLKLRGKLNRDYSHYMYLLIILQNTDDLYKITYSNNNLYTNPVQLWLYHRIGCSQITSDDFFLFKQYGRQYFFCYQKFWGKDKLMLFVATNYFQMIPQLT